MTNAKRLSGEERKEKIIGAAARLFSKKGFKGTTTREVAKEAGITEAAIFRYFPGKSALYSAIINSRSSDSTGASMLAKRLRGKSGRMALKEIALFFMERHRKDPTLPRLLLFSALESRKFSELFIKSRWMETLDLVTAVIKDMIRKGRWRACDAQLAGRAYLGMVIHYSLWHEVFGLKRFFRRPEKTVSEAFVKIFVEGMERR
jgi:AcrR family transcriptional regulator